MSRCHNSKYNRYSSEEIRTEIEKLTEEADVITEIRSKLSHKITSLRYKARYLRNLLGRRDKSPYKGEYYKNSEFRKRYGKPFRELSTEDKHLYCIEYWEKNRERLLAEKRRRYRENKGEK